MKTKIIKSILFFLLAVLAGHLAESIVFGLALNSIVSGLWRDEYTSKAVAVTAVYGVIAHVVFSAVYSVISSRSVEFREYMKNEIRAGSSAPAIFKNTYLKNLLYEVPVYFTVLLPFTLYFSLLKNIDLSNSFSFEKFHITEFWLYITTGSAASGIILSVVMFFLILYAVRFIMITVTRKSLIENSVTLQG